MTRLLPPSHRRVSPRAAPARLRPPSFFANVWLGKLALAVGLALMAAGAAGGMAFQ
jgi:hypothetical protein